MAIKKKRIALVGCGGISHIHIEGFKLVSDRAEVVAVCDVNSKNAELRAEQAGGATVYSDWKELIAKEQIDAVDICLPHHLHKPAILDFAKAKKHILCEKPLCLTMQEAKEIVATIKKERVLYMSAHNQIFDPIVRKAKAMLDEGAIGEVYYLRTQDCFRIEALHQGNRDAMAWRANVKTQGGGELIDTGYHPSYLLLYLAGSPLAEVTSVLGNFTKTLSAEDSASVNVRFKNGVIGQILTSWAFQNPYGGHQIHAIGSKGQIFGSQNDLYYLPTGFEKPAHLHVEGQSGYLAEIEHFVGCLVTRKQPVTTLQQGVDVLELILKATGRFR
jgi:predicted dehydrogenase